MLARNPYICSSDRDIKAYEIFRQAEDLAESGVFYLYIYFTFIYNI
jgi:hypothetical protein